MGEKHLYVEYYIYKGYEAAKDEFLKAVSAFFSFYTNSQISRFGMRYINNINISETNPTDWTNYISGNLLSIFKLKEEGEEIARAFHIFASRKNGFNLTFQYGMHNADYPAAVKKKEFILDYDVYVQGAQGESDIKQNIDTYHDFIVSKFEGSIKDGLRRKMDNE